MSSTLCASPISKVHYDVLGEIFDHCLPEHPLARYEDQQPNINLAPLLLCQVFSSWRTVALVSARLWSHLRYSFTVCVTQEGDKHEYKLLAREVEFLQWWRKNQRAIPPFLHLSVKGGYRRTYVGELAQGGMDFVMEYAASAQNLELSPFFWVQIHKRSKAGNLFMPSKLHTLVRHGVGARSVGGIGSGYSFFQSQMLFQPHNLRRLAIDEYRRGPELNIIPSFWSTLTHISIWDINTTLSYWFTLLRGLPQLEWAHFSIEEEDEFMRWDPSNIILPHLSTLYLAMRDSEDCREHIPFSSLFTNIHLPALHTLSLSWSISQPGHIYSIAAELSAILKFVPTVTTLTLAGKFLEIVHPALDPAAFDAEEDEEPIWKHAAHVAELRLEAYGFTKRMDPLIWDMLFTQGRWFDLQDMACPVRVVTIADPSLAFVVRDIGESDEAVMARSPIKRELAEKAPNIVFRFTLQSETTMIDNKLEEWEESM
ncbi:hypothetical protein BJ912DRAFT_1047012 [Pholiota molesta]|nr:hypothetical protein BJ912DRAFT_1047012 [Pholiota molesta]